MRPGIDFNDLIQSAVDERVNIALERLEEKLWPKWMDETKGAAYLSISKKQLGNARRAGKVVGHPHGRSYIYARAELDHFAQKGS
jgi:hypothetical protein